MENFYVFIGADDCFKFSSLKRATEHFHSLSGMGLIVYMIQECGSQAHVLTYEEQLIGPMPSQKAFHMMGDVFGLTEQVL